MPNLKLGFIPEAASTASPWAGLTGRIDRTKLQLLAPDFLARETFCCGPDPFMKAVSGFSGPKASTWATTTRKASRPRADAGQTRLSNLPPRPLPNPPHKGRGSDRRAFVRSPCGGDGGRPEGVFSDALTIDILSTGEFVTCEPGDTVLKARAPPMCEFRRPAESGMCGTARSRSVPARSRCTTMAASPPARSTKAISRLLLAPLERARNRGVRGWARGTLSHRETPEALFPRLALRPAARRRHSIRRKGRNRPRRPYRDCGGDTGAG